MTTKREAIWSGIAAGVTGYIAYFLALPPNLQTGIMGDIIALMPADWQPAAAGVSRTVATFLGFYATYKAAQSGPQTPPANPAQ